MLINFIVQIKGFLSRKIMNKIIESFLTKSVPVDEREYLHIFLHPKQKSLKKQITASHGSLIVITNVISFFLI